MLIFYAVNTRQAEADAKHHLNPFSANKKLPPPWKFDFHKYKHYIFYYLQGKSFFKRFGRLQEYSKELESSMIQKYEKNELVLMPSEEWVGVVLCGSILAISHANANCMKPRLLFKCIEGTILGHPTVDNGDTSNSETWLLTFETTEVIFLKREHFERMWDL